MKQVFKAYDGELFENMEDCAAHEENVYNQGIQFYGFGTYDVDEEIDPHFIPLDWEDVSYNIYNQQGSKVEYIYCATPEFARYANNLLKDADLLGLEVFRAGFYKWNGYEHVFQWIQEGRP